MSVEAGFSRRQTSAFTYTLRCIFSHFSLRPPNVSPRVINPYLRYSSRLPAANSGQNFHGYHDTHNGSYGCFRVSNRLRNQQASRQAGGRCIFLGWYHINHIQ